MGSFVAEVRPRWSDMDVFGHVNHANTVTLLEEARIDLLFGEAARRGLTELARGIVVSRLSVDYHRPMVADGRPVRVELSVTQLRAASFVLDYRVRQGRDGSAAAVVTAQTTLVPYDRADSRPRRLTDAERDFLAGWRVDSDSLRASGA